MHDAQLQFVADLAALQFYIDAGVQEVSQTQVNDFYALAQVQAESSMAVQNAPLAADRPVQGSHAAAAAQAVSAPPLAAMGRSEAVEEAAALAKAAQTPEELKSAIEGFEALKLKTTAANLVFAHGNAKGATMVIGDAPGSDDDRSGRAFSGVPGALLDKILGSIGLSRDEEDLERAVYLSHVLNWRPPGNRSASEGEIEMSLPFIERHIQLIAPKRIVVLGGSAGKALLGSRLSITKLRGRWHEYSPVTEALAGEETSIPMMVTYNPDYLLNTPGHKRAVWADMLMLKAEIKAP